MQYLSQALQITVVGMGLVFLGILALWMMMSILVNFFADKKESQAGETAEFEDDADNLERKRLAAAIAAACAIEMHTTSISASSHKEREMISAWQAAHRSQQLHINSPAFHRKNRGLKQ